jgi:hypothetical protein
MIAYHFPPEGNAGAYRPLRFVRNLPKFGWHPRVISLAAKWYERYDPRLLAPAGKTGRVNFGQQSSVRASIREMARQAEAWIYHPDPEIGWVRPALKATLKSCMDKAPDVIWATAGPISSFIVAKKASQRTGIPYVLDFRDSWTITYNEFQDRRPRWAKRLTQCSMYRLLAGAQSVVFRYASEAECYWRVYSGALEPSKVYILPNGFEGVIDEFVLHQSDRCEILYTGTVSDYRYDTLLRALVVLKKSLPELASRLHFHFIGEGSEAVAKDAAALGVVDLITTQGPSSYEEVNKLTKRSHALLILGRPASMRGYELFAGAKLFGYLKAGMPIIGILPQDETRNVLRRIGVTTIADVDRGSEIVAVLQNLAEKWSERKLVSLLPDRRACERYSAERQTEELARALKGLPALERFLPGSAEIPPSLRCEITKRADQFKRSKPNVTPAAMRRFQA